MAGLAWAKDYHRQWVKMNYIMSNGLSPTPINAPGWLNSGVASLLVNGHVPQGLELTNQNLAGLVFPHGDLSQVALIGCDLRFANLEGADLTDANLIAASLHKSNLRRANLCRATLNRCNLSEADRLDYCWFCGYGVHHSSGERIYLLWGHHDHWGSFIPIVN